MAKAEIEIISRELDDAIDKAMKRLPVKTVKAVKWIAIDLAGKSAELAPIESGDLRNNCNAELNGATIFENTKPAGGFTVPATAAYASVGYSLPYALRQHEDLTLRHDRDDGYERSDGTTVNMIPGGEAKYLERPFIENAAKYMEALTKIVDDSFGEKL